MLVTEAVLKSSKLTAKNYVGGEGRRKGREWDIFTMCFLPLKKKAKQNFCILKHNFYNRLPITRLVYPRRQWHPTPVLLPGKSHGRRSLVGCRSDFTFTFHFHALEKEMATHSSVLAWRIPGTAEPGGLPSMGSHRVGHDWIDLAAAAAGLFTPYYKLFCRFNLGFEIQIADQTPWDLSPLN